MIKIDSYSLGGKGLNPMFSPKIDAHFLNPMSSSLTACTRWVGCVKQHLGVAKTTKEKGVSFVPLCLDLGSRRVWAMLPEQDKIVA